MSYILDALRKSDQQRQRGMTPTLLTPQTNAIAPRQNTYLLYGAVAVALIGAGTLLGWLLPGEHGGPVPVAAPGAATSFDSRQTETSVSSDPVATESVINLERRLAAEKSSSATVSGLTPGSAAIPSNMSPASVVNDRSAPQAPESAVAREATTPVPGPDGAARAKSAGDQRVIAKSELPISVQQEIPRMLVAMHAYSSNPLSRVVMINDRLLHEGAQVDPSMRLEEITPDGMILTFREYRFHVRARGNEP